MAFDPTFSAYALWVDIFAAATASAMHGVDLVSAEAPLPARRRRIANLIKAAFLGACVAEAMRAMPIQFQVVPVLLAAGLFGGVLGPRGLVWALQVVGAGVRALPGMRWVPELPQVQAEQPATAAPAKAEADDA